MLRIAGGYADVSANGIFGIAVGTPTPDFQRTGYEILSGLAAKTTVIALSIMYL